MSTPSHSSPSRLRPSALLGLLPLLGLLAGLVLAFAVARSAEPAYTATTNYAILPGKNLRADSLGQVQFLTPVFGAEANDPGTAAEVKSALGGSEPAEVAVRTFPDSPLLFSVTATDPDAQKVIRTLQAYEKVLTAHSKAGQPVSEDQVRLDVATHAKLPTEPAGLSPKLIYLAGGLAGAAVGLALALGLARRAARR